MAVGMFPLIVYLGILTDTFGNRMPTAYVHLFTHFCAGAAHRYQVSGGQHSETVLLFSEIRSDGTVKSRRLCRNGTSQAESRGAFKAPCQAF